jgi:hypothetical protein
VVEYAYGGVLPRRAIGLEFGVPRRAEEIGDAVLE